MTEVVSLEARRADKTKEEDVWGGCTRKDYVVNMLREAADKVATDDSLEYVLIHLGYEYESGEGFKTWHSPMTEAEYYTRLCVLRRMAEDDLIDGD